MKRSVRTIKHVINTDVDVTLAVDVKVIDAHVFSCLAAAQRALEHRPISGFSDAESDHIWNFLECIGHSHKSIRKLLRGDQSSSAVDALAIARLQLESLFTLCYLLQSSENVRLFLKNGWKKKYVRFLLQREEHIRLSRFDDFYNKTGLDFINKLQGVSFVTDEERRTIDYQELGEPIGPIPLPVEIPQFPTPGRVIQRIVDSNQKQMLERLYPEYEFLCSFAHGDAESVFFRNVSDPRSRYRQLFSTSGIEDFYQRQVLEPPVMYSVLSAVQVATEIAALYPNEIELRASTAKAWDLLVKGSLYAVPTWELRASRLLGVVRP